MTIERGEQRERLSPYRGVPGERDLPEALSYYVTTSIGNVQHARLLDNVNFSGEVFPHVIDPRRVFDLYPLEPGYTTLDAEFELGELIRHLETVRLAAAEPARAEVFRAWLSRAGVGVSNCGCTGVIQQVLTAVLELPPDVFPRQNLAPEIVMPLPCYSVFPIQMDRLRRRAQVRWVVARREDDFMPRFEAIRAAITDRTVAVVLPYPTNPSMATYEGARLDDLRSIVRFCQQNGLFLIADNIFQDMLYPAGDRRFEEVLFHADGLEGIVKIYGPSKDVPFFAGYRLGYWIGDRRLARGFRAAARAANNGINTLSLILFALHLYFRALRITKRSPDLDDMGYFADGLFGTTSSFNRVCEVGDHRKLFDRQRLLDKLVELDCYGSYQRGMAATEQILCDTLRAVRNFATASEAFSDWVNHDIGNVFFLKADPSVFPGDDDELFHTALAKARVAILPGNGFGLERRAGDAWFRITTTHAPAVEIVADLERLARVLLGSVDGARHAR